VSKSNPDGGILTTDRNHETGITCIRLQGTKVTTLYQLPTQADSDPLPACAPPATVKHAAKAKHRHKHRHHHHKRRHHRHHRRHHRHASHLERSRG
jgi:hypothetical protein